MGIATDYILYTHVQEMFSESCKVVSIQLQKLFERNSIQLSALNAIGQGLCHYKERPWTSVIIRPWIPRNNSTSIFPSEGNCANSCKNF